MLFVVGSLVSVTCFIYFGNVLILNANVGLLESESAATLIIKEPNSLTRNQVRFNDNNQLTVNDEIVLSVRPGSANYRFLRYMFENCDKAIPISRIYEQTGIGSNVYINKLICNTHIPKEIRQQMFSISNGHVTLNTTFHTAQNLSS